MAGGWIAKAVVGAVALTGVGLFQISVAEEASHEAETMVIELGDLRIMAPVLRETPPNARTAAGFATISNEGDEDDTLIAVSARFAERGELHDMAIENDVMRMFELEEGMPIPAGGELVLDPATPGLHLMFINISEPLVEGETREVTLTFERAGEISASFPVQRFTGHGAHGDDDAHGHDAHGHGEHGDGAHQH